MDKQSIESYKQLLRCPSAADYAVASVTKKNSGTSTTINTSSSSIESAEDQYRKLALKWLLEFDRKVTKDTNYLAAWYLEMLLSSQAESRMALKESNWQLVAAAIMLFASKMNQIYPPSINSIIKRCTRTNQSSEITRESLIMMEGDILGQLDFSVAIQTPFNWVCHILEGNRKDIQQCQKLFKIVIYNRQICRANSETIAYAMIYLISRNSVDQKLTGEFRHQVKQLAQVIYNYYKDVRKNYELRKQQQRMQSKTAIFKDSKSFNTSLKTIKAEVSQCQQRKPATEMLGFQRHCSYKALPSQTNIFKTISQNNNTLNSLKQTSVAQPRKLYRCISKEDMLAKENYKSYFNHV